MFIDLPHKTRQSFHYCRALSTCNQTQIKIRSYRLILGVFTEHLSATISSIQDCLQDLDESAKLWVNCQKQQSESALKHLFYQHASKLCKESNYRNRDISKSCQQYYSLYYSVVKPRIIKPQLKTVKQMPKQQVKHGRSYTQQEGKYEYTCIQRQKLPLHSDLRREVGRGGARMHQKVGQNTKDCHAIKTYLFDTHEHQYTLKAKESLSKFIQLRQNYHRVQFIEQYQLERQKEVNQAATIQNQEEWHVQHSKVISPPIGVCTKRVFVFRNRILEGEIGHSGLLNKSSTSGLPSSQQMFRCNKLWQMTYSGCKIV